MISRQIPKKIVFEVGQLHSAVGSILYKHTSTKYIHLYAKCYLQQHEVVQLQKKCFLGICLLIIL